MYSSQVSFNLQESLLKPFKVGKDGKAPAAALAFGLFGGDPRQQLNPAINVEDDVVPKEGDYIYVPFRMLSETIVGGDSYKATDFRKLGVLMNSASMLLHKPVYLNHDLSNVLNNVGIIVAAQYVGAFTAPDGTAVPAGIDGIFKIDAKLHPDVARALLSNPPSIQSCSVTVFFDWVQSHTFSTKAGEPDYQFINNLGNIVDGKMVCRVATKIDNYLECSLVSLGADPFAKIKDKEGNLINIEKNAVVNADKFNSFKKAEEDPYGYLVDKYNQYLIIIPGNNAERQALQAHYNERGFQFSKEQKPQNPKPKNGKSMFDVQKFMAEKLNLKEGDEITEAMLADFSFEKKADIDKLRLDLQTAQTAQTTLAQELSDAKVEDAKKVGEIASLKTQVTAAAPAVAYMATQLTAEKEELYAAYAKAQGTGGLEAFKKGTEALNGAEIQKLRADYGLTALKKFGATCTNCKTDKHITMQSSERDPAGVAGFTGTGPDEDALLNGVFYNN